MGSVKTLNAKKGIKMGKLSSDKKRYRKDTYIMSIDLLIEWKSSLEMEPVSENTKNVIDQIDDILTSMEL